MLKETYILIGWWKGNTLSITLNSIQVLLAEPELCLSGQGEDWAETFCITDNLVRVGFWFWVMRFHSSFWLGCAGT